MEQGGVRDRHGPGRVPPEEPQREGNPDTKRPFNNPGIRDCITQAADRIGWRQNWHAPKAKEVRPGVFHGIGLAAHACSHGGGGNPASGQVIVNTDGTRAVRLGQQRDRPRPADARWR